MLSIVATPHHIGDCRAKLNDDDPIDVVGMAQVVGSSCSTEPWDKHGVNSGCLPPAP